MSMTKELQFTVTIDAPRQKVWKTMLEPASYKEWVGVSWPGSRYIGEWKKDASIRFVGGDGQGGTLATIVDLKRSGTGNIETFSTDYTTESGGIIDRPVRADTFTLDNTCRILTGTGSPERSPRRRRPSTTWPSSRGCWGRPSTRCGRSRAICPC